MCWCGTEQTSSSFHQKCNLILTMPYGIAERIAHLTLNSYHSYSITVLVLNALLWNLAEGPVMEKKKLLRKQYMYLESNYM